MADKPTLLMEDLRGHHNLDPETESRILKGGSYKPQRVVVVIPALQTVHVKVLLSWMNMAYPANQAHYSIMAMGMEVGDAYSTAVETILNQPVLKDCEYILTAEHDNTPPPFGIIQLMQAMEEFPQYSCISGLYFTKGQGGIAQIWGDPLDLPLNFRPQPFKVGEVVECCGTGMGFALWRMQMFRELTANQDMPKPLFKTKGSKEDGGVGTQDLSFWGEARKFGYRCAVDCRVPVGHVDGTGRVW